MAAGATVFDIELRVLECQHCGAPVAVSRSGGSVRCTYCHADNQIESRPTAARAQAPAPSAASEVARLSRLKTQEQAELTGHAYDMQRPPPGFNAFGVDPAQLRSAWEAAKGSSARDPESQRVLCWLALKRADVLDREGRPQEERAVLETAISHLSDDGHRHLLRCRLAVEAAERAELDAAEGWLAECDPVPEVLVLDSAYRAAAARIALRRRDFARTLSLTGRLPSDIPVSPSFKAVLLGLRIEALEGQGQEAAADQALDAEPSLHGQLKIEGLAERALTRKLLASKAAELSVLQNRGVLGVLSSVLGLWAIAAVALTILVAIPRCTFNADPLLGVQGYALCPAACVDCDGPTRVITVWSCGGGECTSNGAEFYCPTPTNQVAEMTDDQLEANRSSLTPYRLDIAPAAASYLILLGLLSPFAFVTLVSRLRSRGARLRLLKGEVAELCGELGIYPPTIARRRVIPVGGPLVMGLAVGIAVVLIAAELALR